MKCRCETARVVAREKGRYKLKVLSVDAAQCARCGLCAASGQAEGEREVVVDERLLPWNPRPGTVVKMLVPDISATMAALVVLGIPLGAAVGGLFAAGRLGLDGWPAVGVGALGFALGWMVAYLGWGRRHRLRFEPGEEELSSAEREN